MRFIAPPRGAFSADCFEQPVFAGLQEYRELLESDAWPGIEQINQCLAPLRHARTGRLMQFVEQDALDDGDNYELRIFDRGVIATRARNWHDLLNALAWNRFPAIKSALNAAQVEDMRRHGAAHRTRRQYALTQFDEAGAVVRLGDPLLQRAWDRHDWTGLFLDEREAWSDGRIELTLFGHALFEHALNPSMLLVSKTLVVFDPAMAPLTRKGLDGLVAQAIGEGRGLLDPQELRPLPLAGIPGWHRGPQDAAFYRETPCFRPLREGRGYGPPIAVDHGVRA